MFELSKSEITAIATLNGGFQKFQETVMWSLVKAEAENTLVCPWHWLILVPTSYHSRVSHTGRH